MKGLEVDTCCRYPAFSENFPLKYETGSSASNIAPTLSRPYSFSTDVNHPLIELKVPVSNCTSSLCASSHSTFIKVEENTTNCHTQPVSISHVTNGTRDLCRSQKIRKMDNWEPLDVTFNPLMCETNGSPPAYQANCDHNTCQPESMPSETFHSLGITSSSTRTAKSTGEIDMSTPKQNELSEKKFVCEINGCNKSYRRLDDLKRHQRIHSDVRKFSCHMCDKAFTRSDHLRTHQRTHTGDRPYKCPYCERSFARSDERRRHAKVHLRDRSTCIPKAKRTEPVTAPKENLADYPSEDIKIILFFFAVIWYLLKAMRKPEQNNNNV